MAAAHPFASQQQSGWDMPSALVVGDTPAAVAMGERAFHAADRRTTAMLAMEAIGRLDRRDLETVWVEIEGDLDEGLEALLRRVDADVSAGRYGAVVSAMPEQIDPIIAAVSCPDVEVVINGSDVDRAAALALSGRAASQGVRDGPSDASAARLRQLSEEVSRIASTLARLSSQGTPSPTTGTQAPPTGDLPQIPAESVRSMIRARRLRTKYFADDLFADPAWDMLLDLLQAEIVQHRVPVSSLCMPRPCRPLLLCGG